MLPREQILWFTKKTSNSSVHKSGLAYICWFREVVYNFLHYYKMKMISRWGHYFLLSCIFCVRFLLGSAVCDFSRQVRGVEGAMGRQGNLSPTLWWNTQSNPFPLEGYESQGISKIKTIRKSSFQIVLNNDIISKSCILRVFKFAVENLDYNSGFHIFSSNIVIS